jgi:hypothetical protein
MGLRARERKILADLEAAMARDPVSGEFGQCTQHHAREPMPPAERVTVVGGPARSCSGSRQKVCAERRQFPAMFFRPSCAV